MNVLVLNCGSSTVKFQLIQTDQAMMAGDLDRKLARGVVERIGGKSQLTFKVGGRTALRESRPIRDHQKAVEQIVSWVVSEESGIEEINSPSDIHAVGHRVVHGGERFQSSTRITREVLEGIEECIELAPLHNPANLKGIAAVQKILGTGVPQAAVFDTAFHQTMPPESYLYAVPYQLYRRHKLRRYGFHGTSHRYIAYRYRKMFGLEKPGVKIISLHLGNGCSACAIVGGQSLDTSMGMTPLEGLVMGTRCGDIDPSICEFLVDAEGLTPHQVDTMLNKSSGLLGISGLTGDMRDLLAEREENQDRRATLAIDIFCNRVKRYIGGYLARRGGADAVVFTGGIGENSAEIRAQILTGLDFLGIELDPARNQAVPSTGGELTREGSRIKALMIPTDEELLIARDTARCLATTQVG
ncbi:MAG: acetate kinase [Candidatus Eremiobacteraeota bacterium]|nr:acetate kinase [Candidatus Eremiobacteraeota bacterium]